MNEDEIIKYYQENFNVLGVINLHDCQIHSFKFNLAVEKKLEAVYKEVYDNQDRVLFVLNTNRLSTKNITDVIKNFLTILYGNMMPTYFSVLLTNNVKQIKEIVKNNSLDEHIKVEGFETTEIVNTNLQSDSATGNEKEYLLTKSKYFCIFPWIQLNPTPDGSVYPCCRFLGSTPIGNVNQDSLQDIWNSPAIKNLRQVMLTDQFSSSCNKCYEEEHYGFESYRQFANKTYSHHIKKVYDTTEDGTANTFELIHWDIRFSNICNLSCRSCGPGLSSNWFKDGIKIDPSWKKDHPTAILKAGKYKTDIRDQLLPHLDFVERIYFAGGEPLMMEEHWWILSELESRGKFDVKLIYNSNFTNVDYKDQNIFKTWKKFNHVVLGASLDAAGTHAEYIRKGTEWNNIEKNRRTMMEVCPDVFFHVTATLSILNLWHLPDFNKDWVEQGLVLPKNFKLHILQSPPHLRIDIISSEVKEKVNEKYLAHIEWLKNYPNTQEVIELYKSAITFMLDTDNSFLQKEFWKKTKELDQLRNEDVTVVIPEIEWLCPILK